MYICARRTYYGATSYGSSLVLFLLLDFLQLCHPASWRTKMHVTCVHIYTCVLCVYMYIICVRCNDTIRYMYNTFPECSACWSLRSHPPRKTRPKLRTPLSHINHITNLRTKYMCYIPMLGNDHTATT